MGQALSETLGRPAARALLDSGTLKRDLEAKAARERDEQERAEAQANIPVLRRAIELGNRELEQLREKCSHELAAGAAAWFAEAVKRLAEAMLAAHRAAEQFALDCQHMREQFARHDLDRTALPCGAFADQYSVRTDAGRQQTESILQRSPTQVVFQDLVIQGGLAQDNGVDGALAGTTDALGGGIFSNGGDLTLDHVVVQNNVARGGDAAALGANGHDASGGAIYSTGGALTIAAATLTDNQTAGGRGGDYIHGGAGGGDGGSACGGCLYATGGFLNISASMVASNRATGGGGGDGTSSFFYGGNGGVGQGGGLYVNGSALTISTSTIASNQAAGGAGGRYGNAGPGCGGGLYNLGALMVSNSTLSGNSAFSDGGGIYNYGLGTLTVSNSTLSGNSAIGSYGDGGGIANYGTLTVTGSTLSGNSAFSDGGGIYNLGRLMVTGSTLSGNSAYYGGGIYIYSTGSPPPVTLTNVTLTANRAFYPGGIHRGGGVYATPGSRVPPVLHNTLIAGNFTGPTGTSRDDVYGVLNASGDYNLIGDGSGMYGLSDGVNGNQVGGASAPIDPRLGPLADNGGPTLTHALLSGSPAIDAGNNSSAPMWDQRGPGFPRIIHGTIDIGALEYRPARQVNPNPVPISEPGPGPAMTQPGLARLHPTLELAATTRSIPGTDSTGNGVAGRAVAPVDGYFALRLAENGASEADSWVPELWLNQDRLFA
jgi:hypothetical protein